MIAELFLRMSSESESFYMFDVLNFILAAWVNAIGYLSYNYFIFFLDFILTQLANSKGKKKKKNFVAYFGLNY